MSIDVRTVDPGIFAGRLTYAAGFPDYRPFPATPSATDTGAEFVTFAADPGWTTGTVVTPISTGGGLTATTLYYVLRLTSVTYSFHATLANAEADASRINLTASITAQLQPLGVNSSLVKFSPYHGGRIALYTSAGGWRALPFSTELTGSNSGARDWYAYDNAGVVAIESAAAATAYDVQDGVLVKTGDPTRRFLGKASNDGDLWIGLAAVTGATRTLWNLRNQVPLSMQYTNLTSHTYNATTVRQYNADAFALFSLTLGRPQQITLKHMAQSSADTDGRATSIGWGAASNSFLALESINGAQLRTNNQNAQVARVGWSMDYPANVGVNSFYVNQAASSGVTSTFSGVVAQIESMG